MSKIITVPCTLSYPFLASKAPGRVRKDGTMPASKYQAAFVFDPGTDLTPMKSAIAEAVVATFGVEKAKDVLSKMILGGSVHNPLRQDVEKKYGTGDHYFINAKNDRKPQCVHPYGVLVDGKMVPKSMTDEEVKELMYPGCRVKASITFYWFDNESKGVAASLGNVQWLAHGERLDNVTAAKDEFEVVADAAASDLAALLG
jgi:hypothetical protein